MWSMLLVTGWLMIAGIMDVRTRRVPIWMLVLGGALAICAAFCQHSGFQEALKGLLPGTLLLLIAFVTKKAGYGDGIVLGCLGMALGSGKSQFISDFHIRPDPACLEKGGKEYGASVSAVSWGGVVHGGISIGQHREALNRRGYEKKERLFYGRGGSCAASGDRGDTFCHLYDAVPIRQMSVGAGCGSNGPVGKPCGSLRHGGTGAQGAGTDGRAVQGKIRGMEDDEAGCLVGQKPFLRGGSGAAGVSCAGMEFLECG